MARFLATKTNTSDTHNYTYTDHLVSTGPSFLNLGTFRQGPRVQVKDLVWEQDSVTTSNECFSLVPRLPWNAKNTRLSTPAQLQGLHSRVWEPGNEAMNVWGARG